MREYSIKDVKAQEFGPLFQAKNDAVARRSFSQYMTGERVIYIDDYELYCVADFDVETGAIVPDFRLVFAPKAEAAKAEEESFDDDWDKPRKGFKKFFGSKRGD